MKRLHPISARALLGRASLLAVACSAVHTGCNWTEFDDYAHKAPIRVSSVPGDFRGTGYGNVVTTFRTGDNDAQSVVVASAGRETSVTFERMWTGHKIGDATFTRCKRKEDCEDSTGIGGALIPFGRWARETVQEETGCVLAPAQPKAYVFCDSDVTANQSFQLDVGSIHGGNLQANFSGAGLPDGHPLGVVVLGAWSVSTRSGEVSQGRVFVQPDFQPEGEPSDEDEVPLLEELPLTDPTDGELFADANDGDAGDLGAAIGVHPLGGDDLLIAVAQPSEGRVIVARYDASAKQLVTHACIDSPDGSVRGFGKHLVVGDINADDEPEIIVGTDSVDSAERVWLYRGVGLPNAPTAGDACPAWDNSPIEVSCSEGLHGVRCADSAFGASIALGDVDGDGFNDLLVGAPDARVGSANQSGAVWLFPGGEDGSRDGGLDLEGATNVVAHAKANARVGMAVAALHTKERDEPVAGAPGEQRVYTFMCSDLEADVAKQTLCLPK
ncbi:MAG TPA: integrin alpha [Polyangiales bacterium]